MTAQQVFKATVIALLTLVGAYILFHGLRILIVLLLAIIIASSLRPFVIRLTKWHVPEGLAIALVYLGLISFIIIPAVVILPPLINQYAQYIENEDRLAIRIIQAQRWIENLAGDAFNEEISLASSEEIRTSVSEFLGEFRESMPTLVSDIGNGLADLILILIMGVYWMTSHQKAIEFLTQLFPGRYREKVETAFSEIELTLGSYTRGILTVSLIVGLLNFVAMQILGVPNPVTLGLVTGITTAIPMVGGLVGIVLSGVMTLVIAPQYVPIALAVSFVVQQIENYILTPRIMSDNVGLNPLLVIVYTSIGFVMLGVIGALIAVPVMGTIHILLLYFVFEPHRESLKSFRTENGLLILKDEVIQQPEIISEVAPSES